MHSDAYSIYIHIPFCTHRCAYCDFNTYSGLEGLIPAYVQALRNEIRYSAWSSSGKKGVDQPLPVHTVFFGGGTPSLLMIEHLDRIISDLREGFKLAENCEITLEANPGTLSQDYLGRLRQIGINRLSLGMQSANSGDLRVLERQHNLEDVIKGLRWARQAGFDNLNLDLIFGLPYQDLTSWKNTLAMALSLQPEHLAIYALTVEHGTPMGHWVNRGLISEPDPDLAAEMYEYADSRLEQTGFEQYEISNWARRDQSGRNYACLHNLQYWRLLPYIGLGAGAHGFVHGVRTVAALAPKVYIQRMNTDTVDLHFPRTPATIEARKIQQQEEIGDFMLMGLRLVQEGVSEQRFQDRFKINLETVYGDTITRLVSSGLLEKNKDILRLTRRGRLLGNQVFMEFV